MFKKVLFALAAGGAGYGLYLNSQDKSGKGIPQTAYKASETPARTEKSVGEAAAKANHSSMEADRKLSAKQIAIKINEPGEEKKRVHQEVLKHSTVSPQEAEKRVEKKLAEIRKQEGKK